MKKNVIEIKNLSKAYMIGHEQEAMAGTLTLRDSLVNIAKKPVELITGHRLNKEKFWALKDVTLSIEQGDVVGIIGRNGSGKSTLLKILSRIVEPTQGEILMRGKVASLLEVGTGFHPELTGRENIFFNGAILGMGRKEIREKFDEIVAFSEVEKFLDTPVKFYSSGMYVRLAFSVAAHLDPDILIVDEVLAVGDAAFQKKCLGKMKDVAGQGRTVIFVSHSMATVQSLCRLGVLMKDGEVSFVGTAGEAINKYSSFSKDENIITTIKTSDGEFSDFSLKSDSGMDVTASPGETLNLKFSHQNSKSQNKIEFGLGLRDVQSGVRLAFNDTIMANKKARPDKSGMYHFKIKVPDSIIPGDYSLEMHCWFDGKLQFADYLIGKIQVLPYEVVKNGNLVSHYDALIALNVGWSEK